ncbi:MAG: tetratricopeptide repeat protein, partial [Gemmatimonadetes bacterium]|nr:tetratricopeptide repeat protein [Gemmatimonadota bacterium]
LLRQGEYARALSALEHAAARTEDPDLRQGARLYQGIALAHVGDYARARPFLDEAVSVTTDPGRLAEAYLWRGRLGVRSGGVDEGLSDLDRAQQSDPGLRISVLFERLALGVATDDRAMAFGAAADLLDQPDAGPLADSVSAVVKRAALRWGPGPAAALLAPARVGDFPPAPRDRLLLERVALLAEAGDTLAVESEAGWAAQGATPGAVAARMMVARVRLRRLEEVAELDRVRSLLLPAGGDPAVAELAGHIRRVEVLEGWGTPADPVPWFVAAELARDRLAAPRLARGLFLRFASEAPDSPWAGKAVLAALATTPDPRSDSALRAGLESRDNDPYVAEARSDRPTDGVLGLLELRLDQMIRDWRVRADVEVERRDLFLRGVDTLGAVSGGLE